MNIAEVLCRHAALRPDAQAFIDIHHGAIRRLSFSDLEKESGRAAALLGKAGLRAGDGLLVFHAMSQELYTVLIGAFRLGAIPMFLDPATGGSHIERCCDLWPPKALVASAKVHMLRFTSPALRRIPLKFSIGMRVPGAISWDRVGSLSPATQMFAATTETPALVTFTSGSTGAPKAAVRTHGFLLEQHRVLAESLRLTPDDLDLTTLPIFVLANLGSGVCSLIPDADLRHPGAIEPAPVLEQIRFHKPVSTAASPAFLERLADYCLMRNLNLAELRTIFVGGAPVFPNLLRKLHRVAPQAELIAVYGSTEAEPIAEIAYSDIRNSDFEAMVNGGGLLTGAPVQQIRLAVIEDRWGTPIAALTEREFQATLMPMGKPGEIVVSGAHVMPGYLNGMGDSETKFDVDGKRWHRTGDAGYLDGRGRLWLLGRCDARITDERGVLFPFAVECAAQQLPGIRRAAVVAHRGNRLLAVERDREAEADSVSKLTRELAWAHIDSVKTLPKIPLDRRHNAKVNYPELRELLRQ